MSAKIRGALLALALVGLPARQSDAAAPGLWFEVERVSGAEACPGPVELGNAVTSLFDPNVARLASDRRDAALSVKVVIHPVPAGFTATFRVENERYSERRIVDDDPSCRGMPEALAVALVLLIEPHAEARRRKAPPTRDASAPPTPTRTRSLALAVEAGGLGGIGVLGDTETGSLGAFVGLGASYERFGLRVRGVRQLGLPETVGAGSIELDLWAALIGPCYSWELPRGFALLPCLELGLGRQHGLGNFPIPGEASAPWRSVVPEVTLLSPLGPHLFGGVSLGGVFALHRQDYSIDGNVLKSQGNFGLFLALGVAGRFETAATR